MPMTFIEEIEQETYDSFVRNHPKSHFLQSYAWGTFAKLEKNIEKFWSVCKFYITLHSQTAG